MSLMEAAPGPVAARAGATPIDGGGRDWVIRSETVPLGDRLVQTAQHEPGRIALVFPEEQFTYGRLLHDAITVARGLIALGVDRGDHVGLLAPNSPEFVAGFFGATLVGAVVVPLNVRSTPRELGYFVTHGQLKVVLTTDRIRERVDFVDRLEQGLGGLGHRGQDGRLAVAEAASLGHIVLLRGSDPRVLGQDEFEARAATVDPDDVDSWRAGVRIRQTAVILYTSGTTSLPKGCLISHEALSRGSVARISAAYPFEEDDERLVMWNPCPLFHIAALQSFVFVVSTGGTFVTDVYLDADRALESIKQWHPNSLWPQFMAPFRTLRTARGFDASEIRGIRSVWVIGPQQEMLEIQEMFPDASIVAGSGMSESSGWYAISPREDTALERRTTVGKPVAGAEVKVVDPDTGAERPRGERGELWVRTYTLMDGYVNDPEKTAEAFTEDGWLRTGDLFRQLPSDHLIFEGRIKDMLKVGGENVPAIELEFFLCSHHEIHAAEVVGIPDARLDEVPVAFVELVEGSELTVADILEFCRGELASFKIPRQVHFVSADEWPMSSTKVNKRELRTRAIALAGAEQK